MILRIWASLSLGLGKCQATDESKQPSIKSQKRIRDDPIDPLCIRVLFGFERAL